MAVVSGSVLKEGRRTKMSNFAHFLWEVFVGFTIICLAICVESYFHYKNKRGIDDDHQFDSHYQYLGQPIYDQAHHLMGYELLLREFNPQTNKWQLPHDVTNFPLNLTVHTIQQISPQLTEEVHYLALNMTVSQLTDFRAEYFFSWLLGTTTINQLVIEIDTRDLKNVSFFKRYKIRQILRKINSSKIKITIENVDSTKQTYYLLRRFLPLIDYLKFNINAFEKSEHHWIDITLAQWQRTCRANGVEPIVSRIEDPDHLALVDQLKVPLRQGYAYGKPKKLEE